MGFNDKMGEILNVENNLQEILPPENINKNVSDDYEYARNNLKNLIDTGMGDFDKIMDIARQSESPRAFEVATNMLKTLTDTNKDLLDLAKKKKDIMQEKDKPSPQNVTNNAFFGSTAELQKAIKGKTDGSGNDT